MSKLKPETVEDIIKSMENETVIHGEPKDLVWRLANAMNRELDELYSEIQELKAELGL